MSFGNTFETDFMQLIFNATAIATLADNASVSPETAIGFALHTGDPGEAGTQLTNEATYGAYARVDLNRSTGDLPVSSNSVSPSSDVQFPVANTTTTNDITYFSVGKASTDYLIISGTVTPNVAVTNTVQPILTTATAITVD